MKRPTKVRLILLVAITLIPAIPVLQIWLPETSTRDLVVNGGFEDGMNRWHLMPKPRAPEVNITDTVHNSGSYSLRLTGGGPGYIQNFTATSMFPQTLLSFYALLNASSIAGEKPPWALLHLYFSPDAGRKASYYVDITVTPDDSEDLESVFEPNPGYDVGGVYLRFNREPKDSWVHISVDISRLLERHLPDFIDPQVSRIMLESAEGGKVYFDDISLNSTSYVHLQSAFMAWHSFLYSTTCRIEIPQLLSYSVILTALFSTLHWLIGRLGIQSLKLKEIKRKLSRIIELRHR